ncbi:MAG: hypothetical protein ACI85U_000415 [Candidatus Promineifilaceae bacterium]|jgi:hypothetical protein
MTDKEIKVISDEISDEMVEKSGSFMTNTLSSRGVPRWLVMLSSLIGVIYVLNPTFGVLEFIPDNIPLVGNLDEGGAFLLIWYGLLEIVEGRKNR